MNFNEVIRFPVITEKTEQIKNVKENVERLTFKVAPDANKESIRQALHKMYKVDAVKVNIMNVPGAKKRFRNDRIKLPAWKKAIVTLAPGQTIDFAK